MLKCPLCPYTCPRWEWLSNHLLESHEKIDITMKLAELMSSQEEKEKAKEQEQK